jgi:hypothetical protein
MCADYQTALLDPHFEEAVQAGGRQKPVLQHGFYRNPANDETLLSKFGLSWWANVGPYLDGEGRLSVSGSQNLLRILQNNEQNFARAMRSLSETERESLRRRYKLLADFLKSAIEHHSPIHTFM